MPNHFHLKYFSKNNMKRQLITLYICAVMIPAVSIGAIVSFSTCRRTIVHYEDLACSQSRLVHSTIVSTSIYLHSTYENVANSSKLQELLCTDDPGFDSTAATAELAELFDKSLTNTAMLTALRLYVPAGLMDNVEPNQYILPLTDEAAGSRWYQKAREISGNFWTSDTRTGQNDMAYWELHYCCRIPIPHKDTYGVLVMSVSNDYLRNLIADKNYQIYINVNDEPVFLSSDRSRAGRAFPVDMKKEKARTRTGVFTLFEEKLIGTLATVNLYHSSDKLHIFVANTSALSTTRHLLMTFLLIILLSLLVSAVIIFLYATYFSGRINTLRLAMAKVSSNDYEIVDNIRGDDELTAAFHDMKLMVEKLKSAEARLYQSQIHEQMIENQQQQMELKLLANQINPHFLYNTLEAIRMKAFVEGNKDVANAIKLLSKSMRYVLGSTKTASTTLEKELDYINIYMAVMKLRFESCINYDLRVDESITPSNYRILPLLLQPVVENAISHGLRDMEENGRIILKISPSRDRTRLNARIFDNGTGMSSEVLQNVTAQLETPSKNSEHGIGLYNTNNRIHLFYGREYGITIQSKENLGTCVTVTLPLHNPDKLNGSAPPKKNIEIYAHHKAFCKYIRHGGRRIMNVLNVFIADDERLVLEGLTQIIDWESIGVSICGTAMNGQDTLNKILLLKPDLVLLDIRMPKMTGIEVVKAALESGFSGKFIILSGLSDFKLAQTAMRYGVDFYLTKPIDEEELEQAIHTVRNLIEKEQKASLSYSQYRDKAREHILKEILLNTCSYHTLDLGDLHLDAHIYQVITYGNYNQDILHPAWDFSELIRVTNQDSRTYDILEIDQRNIVLLKGNFAISRFQNLLEHYRSKPQKGSPFDSIFLTYGREAFRIQDIHLSYQDVCQLEDRRFFCFRDQHVIGYDELHIQRDITHLFTQELAPKYAESFSNYIQSHNPTLIAGTLNDLSDYLTRCTAEISDIKHFLIDVYILVKQKIMQIFPQADLPFLTNASIIILIEEKYYLYEIIEFLKEQFEMWMHSVGYSSGENVLDEVLHYIQHNYQENLKLETLAPLFGYNSSYLGRLFTKKLNVNFKSYLDQVRISRAKELLDDGNLKVYEIAERVGYSNVDYFHRKFKKYEGTSPAEYRKKQNL